MESDEVLDSATRGEVLKVYEAKDREIRELTYLLKRYIRLNKLQKALLIELNKPSLEKRTNERRIQELKAEVNRYREYGGEL